MGKVGEGGISRKGGVHPRGGGGPEGESEERGELHSLRRRAQCREAVAGRLVQAECVGCNLESA